MPRDTQLNTQFNTTQPDAQPRKIFYYIKWILIIIGILVLIFLILRLVAGIFIKEITQEVNLKTYEDENIAADLNKQEPFFELPDLESKKVKLSDFLGSPLVVTFWTTWNTEAADQIKIFDNYLSKNKEGLFKIITINNQEDKSVVSNFVKRGGYQLEILLDENGAVGELYQAKSLPVSYFLDKNGFVRDIFVGVLNEKQLVDKSEKIIR